MFRKLRGYYTTAVEDLRHQGLEVLLYRVAVKLVSPLARVDVQILYDMDLTVWDNVLHATVPCTIERAGLDDLDEIVDMQAPRLSPERIAALDDFQEVDYARQMRARARAVDTYRRQMLADEYCFVAKVDGAITHSNWLHFHDSAPTTNCPMQLSPGEVYSTDGFTAEAQRGKRLHEAVATHMLDFSKRERGCHLAFTITDMTKAVSRRALRRIGWRRRGTILYVTPRGFERTWLMRLSGNLDPIFAHARAIEANRR